MLEQLKQSVRRTLAKMNEKIEIKRCVCVLRIEVEKAGPDDKIKNNRGKRRDTVCLRRRNETEKDMCV